MRHLALVGAVVLATALALAQDALAAPTQPSKSAVTLGPLATADSSSGTMAAQTTSDPSMCFATDPTTGKPVEDGSGQATVLFTACDEIKVTAAEAGDVKLCLNAVDMDPLQLGQFDLDSAVWDPTTDQVVARADGSASSECLTFRAEQGRTYQALVVPFMTITGTYTATFTWTAPVVLTPVPAGTRYQMNGGGKLPSGQEGAEAGSFEVTGEASFSLLARNTGSNLGKFGYRVNGVCAFMGNVTLAELFQSIGAQSGGRQNSGGVVETITGNGKLNNQPVTFTITQAADFGEGGDKQDSISSIQFTPTGSGTVPAGCASSSAPLSNGNLQFHPSTTSSGA